MKKVFSFLFLNPMMFLLLFACSENSESSKNSEYPTNDSIVAQDNSEQSAGSTENQSQAKSKVNFEIITNTSDEIPTSDISISIGSEKMFIETISGEASIMNEIGGKNSITACGAWWAGAGDYFYVAPSDKGFTVFKGWTDEEQEMEDYHWKAFKEIPSK